MPSQRLHRAEQVKENFQKISYGLNQIQDYLRGLKWQDMDLRTEKEAEQIRYTLTLPLDIQTIYNGLDAIVENESNSKLKKLYHEAVYGSPDEKYDGLTLKVTVRNRDHRIDNPGNGLAVRYRNLGLGKKIYKRVIQESQYITSYDSDLFDSVSNSIYSDLIWHSLHKDDDIHCETNGNEIIAVLAQDKDNYLETIKQYLYPTRA